VTRLESSERDCERRSVIGEKVVKDVRQMPGSSHR
jgi:hypothetical protein